MSHYPVTVEELETPALLLATVIHKRPGFAVADAGRKIEYLPGHCCTTVNLHEI